MELILSRKWLAGGCIVALVELAGSAYWHPALKPGLALGVTGVLAVGFDLALYACWKIARRKRTERP